MQYDTEEISKVWGKVLPSHMRLGILEEYFLPFLAEVGKSSSWILEVGVGTGRMIKHLQGYGVQTNFVGVDISPTLNQAPGIKIMGDARLLPFKDQSFDLVYSLGVIEHFPETALAIAEHCRVAKPGGYIFITTPRLSPYTPIRWFSYLIKFRHLGSFELTLGRNLRIKEVAQEVRKNNCKIICQHSLGARVPGFYKLESLLTRILPFPSWGATLGVFAQKLPLS